MAWEDFKFTPEDGLENTTTFPSKPGSGAAARAQPMTLFNQIKTFLNGTIKTSVTGNALRDIMGVKYKG